MYTVVDRPHGHGGHGGLACNGGRQYEQNHRHKEKVPTIVDPLETGVVKVVSEVGKTKPLSACIVVERATSRASAGRNRLIWTKLNQAEPTLRDNRDHSTLKALVESKRALPSS